MKSEVKLSQAKWLVEPGCVVLVTSGTFENPNVMTFNWQTPVNSADPCLILLAISHVRYSYDLIKQNHELVINVPGEELLERSHFVGTITGKHIDKFKESGLTPVPAKVVAPPLIEQCAAHLECRVTETFKRQTHIIGCSGMNDKRLHLQDGGLHLLTVQTLQRRSPRIMLSFRYKLLGTTKDICHYTYQDKTN